jgi:hypothetical protein
VAAGHPSRYGATIIEIADDPDHPYYPLALLALDGQETQPELTFWLRNGTLTGLQEVVCTLHVPWSRKTYSYRALAHMAGVTPWAVAKHHAAGLARLRTAERPRREPCDDERLWRRWEDWRRLQESPPGRTDGRRSPDPRSSARRKASKAATTKRGGFTVDRKSHTHWPAEKWRPPILNKKGVSTAACGPAIELPQDEDAGRDVLAEERRRAERRRAMVDTLGSIGGGTVPGTTPSRCPAERRGHLSDTEHHPSRPADPAVFGEPSLTKAKAAK